MLFKTTYFNVIVYWGYTRNLLKLIKGKLLLSVPEIGSDNLYRAKKE